MTLLCASAAAAWASVPSSPARARTLSVHVTHKRPQRRRCGRSASFHGSHRPHPHGRCRRGARRHARPHGHGVHRGRAPAGSTHSSDAGCPGADLVPSQFNTPTIRSATLCLVNRERVARGESPLRANADLERAAQAHSESMAFGGYFDHVGPGGDTPADRMRACGYIYSSGVGYEVGENIAFGTLWEGEPAAIVAGWMASPGHRANILDPHFRDTAIGVSAHVPGQLGHGQPGGIYTQDFGVIIR